MIDNAPDGFGRTFGDGIVIVRYSNRDWKQGIGYVRMTTDKEGKRPQRDLTRREVAADSTKGRFRLSRVGGSLTVAHSDGAEDALPPLGTFKVGTEDIRTFRIGAEPGGPWNGGPYRVDLLITDFRLKGPGAEAVAAATAADPAGTTPRAADAAGPSPRRGVLGFVVAAIGLLMFLAGVVWLRRRRAPASRVVRPAANR